MIKCENCTYGINNPIPDEQIRPQRRFQDNWECNHPNEGIREKANIEKWGGEICPEFKPKE